MVSGVISWSQGKGKNTPQRGQGWGEEGKFWKSDSSADMDSMKEADGMSEPYAVEAETWVIVLKWKKKKDLHVQAWNLKQKKKTLKVVFKKLLGQCLLVKSTNKFWERRYADRERVG